MNRLRTIEKLECRRLLASDWHNPCTPLDVSADGIVTPLDALLSINRINSHGSGSLSPPSSDHAPPPYYDVDNNGTLVPLDVLQIVNALNDRDAPDYVEFDVQLANDTAASPGSNTDRVTHDPRISGHVTSILGRRSLEAITNEGQSQPVEVSCGSFEFSPDLPLDGSADGLQTVRFIAVDSLGRRKALDFDFMLDSSAPELELEIALEGDSGVIGDLVTTHSLIKLTGSTDPGVTVELSNLGTFLADANGEFEVSNVQLLPFVNNVTATATDPAGNQTDVTQTITRVPCDFADLTEAVVPVHELPTSGQSTPQIGFGNILLRGATEDEVGVASGMLNQDHELDVVAVDPVSHEVSVFLSSQGQLGVTTDYDSGAQTPVTVAIANFVGDLFPDIAVGHRNGTVTFLVGRGDGTFELLDEATVNGLGEVTDLVARDFDHDGDIDLAVAAGSNVTLLVADNDPLTANPIRNGDFSHSLVGWQSNLTLAGESESIGSIEVSRGAARFLESDSQLSSLSQTFTVPPEPQTISFDLLEIDLNSASDDIPDAFEVSLIDDRYLSVVETIRDDATSFFNVNSSEQVRVSDDVTWDGKTATVDISQLVPGSEITLVFDLVGNQAQNSSTAVIDNVAISPVAIHHNTFTPRTLPGPFSSAISVRHCHYNGDDMSDLIIEDTGLGGFVIFEADGSGLNRIDTVFGQDTSEGEGEADSDQIEFGEVVSSSIDTAGEIKSFTFEASKGQVLFFDAIDGLGIVHWSLTTPESNVLFEKSYFDFGSVELTEAGTYTVNVNGLSSRTGSFEFQINDVTPGPPLPISLNTSIAGTIDVAGDSDSFSFQGKAGQVIYLDSHSGSPSKLNTILTGSDSQTIFDGGYGDVGPIELKTDGLYVLTLDADGDHIDSYSFVVWDVPETTIRAIPMDTPVPGAITIPGQMLEYRFEATAGQTIVFDEIDPGGPVVYSLFAPSGATIFEGIWNDRRVDDLPQSGMYSLVVDADDDGIGPFSFQIADGSSAPTIDPAPNLELTSVTVPRRVFGNEQSIEVTWEITNIGSESVAAGTRLTDRIYLSADDTLDGFDTDPWLAEFHAHLATELKPGESVQRSEAVTLPGQLDGEAKVLVHTDAHNVVFEGRRKELTDNVSGDLVAIYPEARSLGGEPQVNLQMEDGQHFPAGQHVTLSGQAFARPGAVNAIFFVDVSGSTELEVGRDANLDGVVNELDDLNDDERQGDLLDAQIGMILRTAQQLQSKINDLRVSVVAWGGQNLTSPEDAEPLDLGAEFINQTFQELSSDFDENGEVDFEESVRSMEFVKFFSLSYAKASLFRTIQINSGNDFHAAMEELLSILNRAPDADQTQVYFLMDGIQVPGTSAEESLLEEVAAHGIDMRVGQFAGTEVHSELKRLADIIDQHPKSNATAVLVDSPDKLDDIPLHGERIAGVTVNGFGVERFDQGGNFFTSVKLEPGENEFEVTAWASHGEVATTKITLVGDETLESFTNLNDVTAAVDVRFSNPTFNRQTNSLVVDVTVHNLGETDLKGPVKVVFERFDPATVLLAEPDLIDPLGNPVLDFDLGQDGLPAGAASLSRRVAMYNPNLDRFTPYFTVLSASNNAPFFSSVPPHSAKLENQFVYAAVASDADNDRLTYSLHAGPEGLIVDADTGRVAWSPKNEQLGVHSIVLQVEDGYGGSAEQSFQLALLEDALNQPPRFTSVPVTRGEPGQSYAYQVTADDPEHDSLDFVLLKAPPGMTISELGLVTMPSAASGDYEVQVEVGDGNGGKIQQAYVLTVGEQSTNPSSPNILSSPPTIAAVGGAYFYLPLARDPDGDVITFSLEAAPDGMVIDASTGRIDWSPNDTQLGVHPVLLRADDGRFGFATQLFSIEVAIAPPNLPPVFTVLPDLVATESEEYTIRLAAIDGDSDPLSYKLKQGPAGMQVDTTAQLVRFTPNDQQLGVHRVEVRAEDPHGASAIQTFDLEVRPPNIPPQFVSTPPLQTTAGTKYSYAAQTTDSADNVRYRLESALPDMTIDELTGLIVMATTPDHIGGHNVTLVATDDRGAITKQEFFLQVEADTTPPNATVQFSQSILLPGESVTIKVTASDNVLVDSITLFVDGVEYAPDSSGRVIFSSSTPGLFEVIAEAKDSSGNIGRATSKLRVLDPNDSTPPEITISEPVPGEQITFLSDIVGSISASDLEIYRVELARSDQVDHADISAANPAWELLAESNDQIVDSTLAQVDATSLGNDSYMIRVTAQDFSGNVAVVALPVNVDTPAKLGQFSLEFTDVSLQLAGTPINITRRYDSLNSDHESDFGYGWSLDVAQADVRETVPPGLESQFGLLGATPFAYGTRVYLTNPDGQRVGFSFEPEITLSLLGATFLPRFVADTGVYDTLEVDSVALSQRDDGTFEAFLLGYPYNPNSYRLKRADGTTYHYRQSSGLERITDPNGNEIVFDADGVRHSSGESVEFVRDSLGRIASIVDPAGNSIEYEYDSHGNLTGTLNQEGLRTEFKYLSEPNHYLEEVIDPSGRSFMKTEYDEQGRVAATIDSGGNRSEESWDPANYKGTLTDALGNQTHLQYDARGNVVEEVDPLGGKTVYRYDDPLNPDLETRVVDQMGNETRYEYDGNGNLLKMTDALGGTTEYQYDSLGNLTQLTDSMGRNSTRSYDHKGNLLEFTNAKSERQTFTYDDLGRLTSIVSPNGESSAFEYDLSNHLPIIQTNPDGTRRQFDYDQFGAMSKETDELGVVTEFVNDKLGRLTLIRDDAGGEMSFQYTSNLLTSQIDQLGRKTRFEYDDAANLVRYVRANGESVAFGYDANGNRTSVRDAGGNETTFEFDALGRLERETDSSGHSKYYSYDAVGNLTEFVNRNGQRTTYAYDDLYRRTRETWHDDSEVVREFTFSYDVGGNLVSATDDSSSYTFTFDALDRMTRVDNRGTLGVPNVTLSYTYDVMGNESSVQDESSVLVQREFDKQGRPKRYTWEGDDISTARVDFAYDARGALESINRFADLDGSTRVGSSALTTDRLGRETGIEHRNAIDEVLAEYDYHYDAASQLVKETIGDQTAVYEYDDSGQLIQIDHSESGTETLEYDANGNRVTSQTQIGTGNQVLSDETYDYAYDLEGNRIRKVDRATGTTTTYTYDHRNRLTHSETRSSAGIVINEVTYAYDVFNRRIAQTHNGFTRYSVYDGPNVWADYGSNGEVLARYLFGVGTDENLARFRPGEGTVWYLRDKLGTVRDLLSSDGTHLGTIDVSSFGTVKSLSNANSFDRFLFTGREAAHETDLYFYRARFYDANLGRFLSQDPLGFEAGDANLYRYVFNSPLNATDPSGMVASIEYRAVNFVVTGLIGFAITEALCFLISLHPSTPDYSPSTAAGQSQEFAFSAGVRAGAGKSLPLADFLSIYKCLGSGAPDFNDFAKAADCNAKKAYQKAAPSAVVYIPATCF